MENGVSIIVCTFNGAFRLPQTIRHLAAQKVDSQIGWEVVFVDNASTDNSADIAFQTWAKYAPEKIRLIKLNEKRPGKIFALETAFKNASFKYAIICDDDNWLNPDYTQLVFEILESDDRIGAIGGQSIGISASGEFPTWFKNFEDSYAIGQQNSVTGDVTDRGYLWGAGMGTRVELYNETYAVMPSLLTGRLGDTLAAGEDAEYCQRLILLGFKLYYDSRLIFSHYMPESRLTENYRDQLFKGFSASNAILNEYYSATKLLKYKNNTKKWFIFIARKVFKLFFGSSKSRRTQARSVLIFAGLLPSPQGFSIAKIQLLFKQASIRP